MRLNDKTAVTWMLGFGLLVSSVANADQKPPSGMPDAAMMQAAQKNMTPGAEHHRLDTLVGKWTVQVSMWMAPGTKPQMSTGTNENVWVLNTHYLQSTYKGEFAGQPFNGIGYMGYDIVRAEYQFLWLDTMGTGMMYSNGGFDPAAKIINQSGTFGCPMTNNKNQPFRTELKITGPDSYTYSSYGKGPDGKEFKGMEILYTRAK